MKPRLFSVPGLVLGLGIFGIGGCATPPAAPAGAASPPPAVAAAPAPYPAASEPGDVAPAQPVIPARSFSVKDFGAVADIAIDNTAALKKAIAAVNAAGGGTLVIPEGIFRTGPISLCSSINLHLDAGATLQFSPNSADYGAGRPRQLTVSGCHDVLISGTGTIDGHGDGWWGAANALRDPRTGAQFPGPHPARPSLLVFTNCQRIRVEGIHLINSASLNFGTNACDDVTVEGITLLNPPNSPNTDGIDPGGGSHRILIAHCHIDTGDDDICLKGSVSDMLVTDCAIFHGHGISIGSNVDRISNLTVRRCTFEGTATGIRIKCYAGRGGSAENLVYKDLTMRDVQIAISINSNYQGTTIDTEGIGIAHVPASAANANSTKWRHILIRNVQASCSLTAGLIVAVPEVPVEDVTLEHVSITAPTGLRIGYTKDLTLRDVHVKAKSGQGIELADTVHNLADLVPDQPVIPDQAFNLRDFGAVGDGVASDTAAFSKGIAAVSAAGGGKLVVPAGIYLTGPIDLCSGINLHLDAGATILFSAKPADYPSTDTRPRPEILARSLHDVMVSGRGTLDGQGQGWWVAARARRDPVTGQPVTGPIRRPHILSFIQCRRVRVEGVNFRNSPMYNMTITSGSDATVDGITILNPPDSPNTDGIDPKGAQRVLITHCRIDTGDDCIALGGNALSLEQDILITDNTFLHGHGCSIGSGTTGGVRNVLVRRCTFEGTESGVRLKSARTRGGLTEDLVYEDLTMKHVGHPISINSHYEGTTTDVSGLGHTDPAPVTPTTPIWRHIVIRNLHATEGAVDAGLIVGLPEMPAEDIRLENVTIEAPKGLLVAYAKNIALQDVRITAKAGPAVVTGEMVQDLRQ